MKKLLNALLDFIFPPNIEELELREFTTEQIFQKFPPANPPEFPFITSLFSYRNSLVRELIWQIKYKKNRHAIVLASFALYEELKKYPKALLIPIPISKNRRRERGFNQCELIIDEIMKLDNEKRFIKDYSLLIRTRNIEKQTFKNKRERIQNTRSIFEITKEVPRDTTFVIIDDVSTTGSTIKEAYDVFIKAGYTNITSLTVAH